MSKELGSLFCQITGSIPVRTDTDPTEEGFNDYSARGVALDG